MVVLSHAVGRHLQRSTHLGIFGQIALPLGLVLLGLWLCGLMFVTSPVAAQTGRTAPQSPTDGSEPDGLVSVKWYRGNLHTHSLWSDGDDFPEMIVKWYAEHDYNFLALTDHNILAEGDRWMGVEQVAARGGEDVLSKYLEAFGDDWVEFRDVDGNGQDAERVRQVRLKTYSEYRPRFEQPEKFLLMTGEEISDSVRGLPVHMNATNLKTLLRPAGGATIEEAINANMRAALEQARRENREILVHLNHPNFGYAITAEQLAAVTLERFFEVYNGHPGVRHLGDATHPGVERMWDIANTIRIVELDSPPLFGLATDDSHNYHGKPGSHTGRGWIMVRAESLNADSLIRAINAGDFYCSSGVRLRQVEFNAQQQKLSIEIDAEQGVEYRTDFIGTRRGYDRSTSVAEGDTQGVLSRVYSDEVGETLATVAGSTASYELTGDELYVRAVITSTRSHPDPSFDGQTEQAWTQPVGWQK